MLLVTGGGEYELPLEEPELPSLPYVCAYGSAVEPLADEPPPEPLAAFEVEALVARSAAFGPRAGSLPAAICAAINPPIATVAKTASNASFTVSAFVDCRGRRELERDRWAARTVWGC